MSVKVIKLQLICEQTNKKGDIVDYRDIYKILWKLQEQTQNIKNKTIQYCWEYFNFSSDYYKEKHEYLKEEDVLNYDSLDGYIYDKLKTESDLYSKNCSTTIRNTRKEFDNSKSDFIKGKCSIISYKENQPLDLDKKTIKIEYKNNTFYANLNLLNREASKMYDFKNTIIKFKIIVKDNSSKVTLERCIDGIYGISASKMIYDKKKKTWYLSLAHSFGNEVVANLDSNKILGVDLGINYPICASVFGDLKRFVINDNEIYKVRKRIEARKRSLLKQGKNCGDGRIGRGINTRNKPTYDIEDKIARFRDTTNHKYSRELINYAVKNQCGIIQMEDLKGITENANKFLKKWTYYDLQKKIEYKAEEKGIKVIYINPKFTSQRCSKCGFIFRGNRESQPKFCCKKCGFKENADYNASQNIGIKDIDKIIEMEYNYSCES